MMKLLRKQMLLCSILFLVFTLSACSAIGQTDENNLTDSATSAEKTVSVVRGTITPTVSTQTTIVPAVPFIIFSPENGIFNTAVELEEKITAGQIIGTVNGKELKSPVDGVGRIIVCQKMIHWFGGLYGMYIGLQRDLRVRAACCRNNYLSCRWMSL
jgi:hypothetical protein